MPVYPIRLEADRGDRRPQLTAAETGIGRASGSSPGLFSTAGTADGH